MSNKWRHYVAMARPDYWMKHIFIIPGIILAYLLTDERFVFFPLPILLGLISACFSASANYVLNEWCDAEFDRYHPTKKDRPAAAGLITRKEAIVEYGILICLSWFIASLVTSHFLVTTIIFNIMGFIYNVKPSRLKDRVILDVLTESLNNPLRLMLGWSMVSGNTISPLSLFIFYWFGGAFLMATKRLAEYRFIAYQHNKDDLYKYRKSFKRYTENSLLVSSFLYGILSSFFIATFLIKYRNEFLFVFPVFAALFAYYLSLSLRETSIAQTPEHLHKDKGLILIVAIIALLLIVFSFVDIPYAQVLIGKQQGINYKIWDW